MPGASSGSIWRLTCRILPTNGCGTGRCGGGPPYLQTEGYHRLQKTGEIANPAVTDPFRRKKLSAFGSIGQ